MTVAKSLPHLWQKVRKLLIPKLFLSYSCIFRKILPGFSQAGDFSKSRLRLNLGYGKSRLTFADKTPGQGKRKAATPEN